MAGKFVSDPRCTAQDIEAVIALSRKMDATLTDEHAAALRKLFDGPRHAVTGERITKQQSMIRWVAMTIYGLILVFGSNVALLVYLVIYLADNLYPLFNPRKQTIHDRIAGTIVVLA